MQTKEIVIGREYAHVTHARRNAFPRYATRVVVDAVNQTGQRVYSSGYGYSRPTNHVLMRRIVAGGNYSEPFTAAPSTILMPWVDYLEALRAIEDREHKYADEQHRGRLARANDARIIDMRLAVLAERFVFPESNRTLFSDVRDAAVAAGYELIPDMGGTTYGYVKTRIPNLDDVIGKGTPPALPMSLLLRLTENLTVTT